MLSKPLINAIETAWQTFASDLLAHGDATSLTEAAATARQSVEERMFHVLAGDSDEEASPTYLEHAILSESPPIDVLEGVHQHLLSRQLHRRSDGELECRTSSRHRRSQGIYYTPDYIANYLSERCLSDWSQPAPPRVLDPACGCGRFLLAAAQQLLRQGRAAIDIAQSLHGCDLDEEAVDVARRMLTLAITPQLSGSTAISTITETLQHNIVCGNAITDDSPPFDTARGKVKEGPEGPAYPPPVSSSLRPPASGLGSFDTILGNPPYRRELGSKELLDRIAETDFGRRYRAPRMDLWYYFLHRGIELLAPSGRLGFIVGAYWAAGTGANRLISTLRETVHVEEIFQLDRLQVFPGVAGHHMMLVVSKRPSTGPTTVRIPRLGSSHHAKPYVQGHGEVLEFSKAPNQLFRQGFLDLEPPAEHLLKHLAHFSTLEQVGRVRQGIAENPASVTKAANRKHGEQWQIGEGVFALQPEELHNLHLPPAEQSLIRPYHDLCDLGRYDRADCPSLSLIYSTRQTWEKADEHPILLTHLARFRPIMEARRETQRGARDWWQLHWPREAQIWEHPKLITLQMARRPAFAPAQLPTYTSFSTNVFLPNPEIREHLNYFAALLNSRLLWKWFRHHAKRRGIGLEINGHVLAGAPIRRIDFNSPQDTATHDQLVELVDRMLELARRRRIAPLPEIETQSDEIDALIDRAVCELYDLTDKDIAAIEAACRDS